MRIRHGFPMAGVVVAGIAMAQCLVGRLDREFDERYTLPVPRDRVRHGIEAEAIVDDCGTVVPEADAITDLVEDLMPTARRLGCSKQRSGVARMIAVGPPR